MCRPQVGLAALQGAGGLGSEGKVFLVALQTAFTLLGLHVPGESCRPLLVPRYPGRRPPCRAGIPVHSSSPRGRVESKRGSCQLGHTHPPPSSPSLLGLSL